MSESSRPPQTAFNPERFDLLLRACFLTDSNAITAFEQWNSYNDWDDGFNTDEYRLFPQLYRNLSALGFDHPLMAKFRGIARKAWYNNNLFFPRLAATLTKLRDANIPTLILGSAAFALRYFNDHVLSPYPGTGILVREQDARAASAHLLKAGLQPWQKVTANTQDSYFNTRYFNYWQYPNGDGLFMQWQLLPDCSAKNSDAAFWGRAAEIESNRVPSHVFAPTDQLLVTCALGALPMGSTRGQRTGDAMLLLKAAGSEINWDQFLAQIQTHHTVLPTCEILLPLAATFKTILPAPILDKLGALPVSSEEQKNRILWDAVTPTERAQQLWRIYQLRSCNSNAVGFPTFLQNWWGLESLAQVPRHGVSAFRRTSK